MIRIIEHREDISPGEDVFELRVFKTRGGERHAYVVPIDMTLDHAMMEEISKPVARAFLDALTLCERAQIATLWIHDPLYLFPPQDWPVRTL